MQPPELQVGDWVAIHRTGIDPRGGHYWHCRVAQIDPVDRNGYDLRALVAERLVAKPFAAWLGRDTRTGQWQVCADNTLTTTVGNLSVHIFAFQEDPTHA